jgi:hypothetical protein
VTSAGLLVRLPSQKHPILLLLLLLCFFATGRDALILMPTGEYISMLFTVKKWHAAACDIEWIMALEEGAKQLEMLTCRTHERRGTRKAEGLSTRSVTSKGMHHIVGTS